MIKDISRRTFLKSASTALGLTILAALSPAGTRLVNASGRDPAEAPGLAPSAFFTVTPENKVMIMVPSSEMGQGILTTLPMIIADELEAEWDQVEIIQAPARDDFKNPILRNQLTVASASVRAWYWPLRQAGAAGRAMLIEAAAKRWGVPAAECSAEKGRVRHEKTARSLAYGELSLEAAALSVPENPTLKEESQFRYMGRFRPRIDIPDKISGRAVFGQDFDIPDLLHAVLARPPAYGAQVLSRDDEAARRVPGVVMVLPLPEGIAVCATSLEAALRGREALQAKWGEGSHPNLDNAFIEKDLLGLLDRPGARAAARGDAAAALGRAAKVHEAVYYLPCIAHATMEPMNFTAHVRPDGCDLWGPTQGQTAVQNMAASLTGLPPEKVFVHTTHLGCGLGRRGSPDVAAEATIISKAAGKPVKVFWTREEDIKHDQFRAAMAHRIKAGLDAEGRLTGWDHKISSLSILKSRGQGLKNGIDPYCLWGIYDPPESPAKSNLAYPIKDFLVELSVSDLPVRVGPWRSVQNAPNAFAVESFMDELAHLAGKDPLAFRLEALEGNPRAQRVLKTAALNSDWGKPLPRGLGRGLAQHYCFGTHVAHVVEVSVNKKGEVKVLRVDAAVDCGPIVNPDALKAQIEGAAIMALGTVLYEEVKFSRGGVESSNFSDYRVASLSDAPEINVHLVKSDDEIGGIGEPGVPPLAPAAANAVFDAVGVRVRRLPLRPETILAARAAAKTAWLHKP
ncbi:MAG: xanthine dehydrogenase family protein molybdopterin-binding subunit [Pseudomonadota bacterium]